MVDGSPRRTPLMRLRVSGRLGRGLVSAAASLRRWAEDYCRVLPGVGRDDADHGAEGHLRRIPGRDDGNPPLLAARLCPVRAEELHPGVPDGDPVPRLLELQPDAGG